MVRERIMIFVPDRVNSRRGPDERTIRDVLALIDREGGSPLGHQGESTLLATL